MNNEIVKKEEAVETLKLVEKTIIEIVGWYWDREGLRVPVVKRTTVFVPEEA